MDNLSWLRMRWIALMINGLVLIGIALVFLSHPTMSRRAALIMGCITGLIISRLALTWKYEMRLKNVFSGKTQSNPEETKQ